MADKLAGKRKAPNSNGANFPSVDVVGGSVGSGPTVSPPKAGVARAPVVASVVSLPPGTNTGPAIAAAVAVPSAIPPPSSSSSPGGVDHAAKKQKTMDPRPPTALLAPAVSAPAVSSSTGFKIASSVDPSQVVKATVVKGKRKNYARRHPCEKCGKAFHCSGGLKTHMRTHTGDKPFTCEYCGKAFAQTGNLKKHIRTHTGDKPFKCDVCSRAFSQSGTLRRHKRIHTGEKPFVCQDCNRCFSESGTLATHRRIHTGVKPYSCPICKKTFRHNGSLKFHVKSHEKPVNKGDSNGSAPLKREACTICGRHFDSVHALAAHQKVHKNANKRAAASVTKDSGARESTFVCIVCKSGFADPLKYKEHMEKHPEATYTEYLCRVCNRAFPSAAALKGHESTHQVSKPHVCHICGHCFSQSGNLKVHMRVHTGDKPFQCTLCQARFTQSGSLSKHMRRHSGVRPFKCAQCQRSFSFSSSLRRHLLTHSKFKSVDEASGTLPQSKPSQPTNASAAGSDMTLGPIVEPAVVASSGPLVRPSVGTPGPSASAPNNTAVAPGPVLKGTYIIAKKPPPRPRLATEMVQVVRTTSQQGPPRLRLLRFPDNAQGQVPTNNNNAATAAAKGTASSPVRRVGSSSAFVTQDISENALRQLRSSNPSIIPGSS